MVEHTEDPRPYCIEGCGRVAVGERLLALTSDGEEVDELVCYEHAKNE